MPSVPPSQPTVPRSNAQHTLIAQRPVRVPGASRTIARVRAVHAPQPRPAPRPAPRPTASVQKPLPSRTRNAAKSSARGWVLGLALSGAGLLVFTGLAVIVGLMLVYSGGILPGVRAAGIDLGGMSEAEAASTLQNNWQVLTLTDPETGAIWNVRPEQIGVTLNAPATAARAYAQGRGEGSPLRAITGLDVLPVLNVNTDAFRDGLTGLREQIDQPALNAGVEVVSGQVIAREASTGRVLDVDATLSALVQHGAALLADGRLELAMNTIYPTLTDATGLVEMARDLLAAPLTVRLYDPVTGDLVDWSVMPEEWARWLIAENGGLSLDDAPVRAYLKARAAGALDSTRYLDFDTAMNDLRQAVAAGTTRATVRVYHHDRQHTVRAGETIISIAWDYGVPYPWVEQANPGVRTLSVGQTLTIPSPDTFLPYEPNPDKRIEVSISGQRVRVYENGALKWDWPASTGINSSPTWPGIYQIISHYPNAYAANWNLYMPSFMGVYQPVPGVDFTNGFHGFPTRGGGQLLWENSLGTRVTYGCILLSSANAQILYDWAEQGVVVAITR